MNEWRHLAATRMLSAPRISPAPRGGANGSYYLKAGTVFNDNAVDSLIGSATAMDLFFRSAGDTISGQHAGELLPISV